MTPSERSAPSRRWRPLRRAALALAMTAAAGVGGAAVAAATMSGGDGTISACRATQTGVLRVIDTEAGQRCQDRLEVPISWNQQGQPGPAGPQGPQGPQGPGFTSTAMYSGYALLNAGQTKTIDASCPARSVVTGGGFSPMVVDFYAEHLVVLESLPLKKLFAEEVDKFRVRLKNNSTASFEVNVYAACAS